MRNKTHFLLFLVSVNVFHMNEIISYIFFICSNALLGVELTRNYLDLILSLPAQGVIRRQLPVRLAQGYTGDTVQLVSITS